MMQKGECRTQVSPPTAPAFPRAAQRPGGCRAVRGSGPDSSCSCSGPELVSAPGASRVPVIPLLWAVVDEMLQISLPTGFPWGENAQGPKVRGGQSRVSRGRVPAGPTHRHRVGG